MLAALLAALAFQVAEPPVVVDGIPITQAELEAAGGRSAATAARLVDRLWLDGEAARRNVEPGPRARRRLALEALDRTHGVRAYGRWLRRAGAHWRARTHCASDLLAAPDHGDLLLSARSQLSDLCAGAERAPYRCEPLALLRSCRRDDGFWFVAGDATRFVGGRANFAAELFLQRRLRRDHPRVARRIGWDTDADFIVANAGTRRDALVVLHTVARLAAERALTRTG